MSVYLYRLSVSTARLFKLTFYGVCLFVSPLTVYMSVLCISTFSISDVFTLGGVMSVCPYVCVS